MTPMRGPNGLMWPGTSRRWRNGLPSCTDEGARDRYAEVSSHSQAFLGKCFPWTSVGREHLQGVNFGPVPYASKRGSGMAAAGSWMSASQSLKKKLQGTPRKKGASIKVKSEQGLSNSHLHEPTTVSQDRKEKL